MGQVIFLIAAFIQSLTHCVSSTRGLDSSTALEYVRALRISTDIVGRTTLVSIYQAGEQLYQMFDKVCLIYEGRMIYFGPADQARQYFIDMGYEPANRQTTADFLVAVTDPLGRKPRENYDSSSSRPLPQTAAEFETYYRNSELRRLNREDLDAYKRDFMQGDRTLAFRESATAEHARHTRKGVSRLVAHIIERSHPLKSPYTISIPMQVRIVMLRRAQIIRGNWFTEALQISYVWCQIQCFWLIRCSYYAHVEFSSFKVLSSAPFLQISPSLPPRTSRAAVYYSCK